MTDQPREISPIKTVGNQIRNFGHGALPADAPDPEPVLEAEMDETPEESGVQESPDPKEGESVTATGLVALLTQHPASAQTESETTVPESADEETNETPKEAGSLHSLLDPNLG